MKKLTALLILGASLTLAGPLKVATYPVVHPKKTAHATKATVKGLVAALKAVVW